MIKLKKALSFMG